MQGSQEHVPVGGYHSHCGSCSWTLRREKKFLSSASTGSWTPRMAASVLKTTRTAPSAVKPGSLCCWNASSQSRQPTSQLTAVHQGMVWVIIWCMGVALSAPIAIARKLSTWPACWPGLSRQSWQWKTLWSLQKTRGAMRTLTPLLYCGVVLWPTPDQVLSALQDWVEFGRTNQFPLS